MDEWSRVVNAGSSSVKFCAVRGGRAESSRPGGRHRRPAALHGEGCRRRRARAAPTLAGAPSARPAARWRCAALAARAARRRRWRGSATASSMAARRTSAGARDAGAAGRARALTPLAPLHQPHNLAPIRPRWRRRRACRRSPASTPPSTAPCRRWCRPTPSRAPWREGIRRYGFHGLSYEYIASRPAGGRAGDRRRARRRRPSRQRRLALCAMRAGRSIATTMGFSALDGPADGDAVRRARPGVVLTCCNAGGHDRRGGGGPALPRPACWACPASPPTSANCWRAASRRARFAIEVFVHRVARDIGSLAAALGGLDGWCSPRASASARPPSGPPFAAALAGLD